MQGSNTLYHDDIFDNNTLLVEVLAQLSSSAEPGSQHNVLITVDYGMDGIDYINNVTVNTNLTADTPTFDPVSINCRTRTPYLCRCV